MPLVYDAAVNEKDPQAVSGISVVIAVVNLFTMVCFWLSIVSQQLGFVFLIWIFLVTLSIQLAVAGVVLSIMDFRRSSGLLKLRSIFTSLVHLPIIGYAGFLLYTLVVYYSR